MYLYSTNLIENLYKLTFVDSVLTLSFLATWEDLLHFENRMYLDPKKVNTLYSVDRKSSLSISFNSPNCQEYKLVYDDSRIVIVINENCEEQLRKMLPSEGNLGKYFRNKFGNFENNITRFVISPETKKVIGKQSDLGKILELTDENKELCKKHNIEFEEKKVEKITLIE